MAKILHNPTIPELLQAIKDEDNGITHKVTMKDIKALPKVTSVVVGTEVIAMQMAMEQCNKLSNLI